MKKEKVLVVFGGKSAEHDISIITGLQVLKNINREKYEVFPLYVSREGEMFFGKKLENYETYVNFNKKTFKKVAFKLGEKISTYNLLLRLENRLRFRARFFAFTG